jgi:glycosyltransferase involved in cell wall biosynthesis
VACSGLGHILRGVEAWADDLAGALRRRSVDVTLFGAGISAGGATTVLPCFRRSSPAAHRLAAFFRHIGGWRYGLGSDYEVEQLSFSLSLWPRIRRGYHILHIQDPLIGLIFDQLNRLHLSLPHTIFANGTGTGSARVRRFSTLQHLTPFAQSQWAATKPPRQCDYVVPNFVNTDTFATGHRAVARRSFDLQEDVFIVLCTAAINKFHKRVDYLIKEFSTYSRAREQKVMLVIAGAREEETDELVALARGLAGDRVRFFFNVPRARMPDLYRAADVFALCSLHETFGIVLLEAMASGLPVICHDAPSFRWIVGPAGIFPDMARQGALSEALLAMAQPHRREVLAASARPHVVAKFSETVVVDQVLDMYRGVLARTPRLRSRPHAKSGQFLV